MIRKLGPMLAFALVVAAPAVAAAEDVDIGKMEYEANCAVCHGERGKGDGPMREVLKKSPADLTMLSTNSSGIFPFDRVYQTIDGRQTVDSHGTRDMPVWGQRYNAKGASFYSEEYGRPFDAESFTRGRILALTSYIYRLQDKGS